MFHVRSDEDVPKGKVSLRYEFEPTGKADIKSGKGAPGHAQLYINEKLVGQMDMPVTVPVIFSITGGLNCGRSPGSAVTNRYDPPFDFTGTIHKVTVDVSGSVIKDTEAEMKVAMARQ